MDILLGTAHYFIGEVIIDDEKGVLAYITINDLKTRLPWTITIPVTVLPIPQRPFFVIISKDKHRHFVRSKIALPPGC